MYDVLATLRRAGAPYELAAGDLVHHTMVTTGAIINRVDRLEARGLVARASADDRRKVIVRLTPDGLKLVDDIVGTHLEAECDIVSALTDRNRRELARLLSATLVALGDSAGGTVD